MAPAQIEAAGGVLWRGDPAAPEVALVHRPRYDDWSLPKGKLDRGEHPLLGARREIEEETGFAARPGRRLGRLCYQVPEGSKRVRFWAFEALGGRFQPNHEVDELWWAPVPAALERLAPDHDRPLLQRFAEDSRRTRVLAIVRHASAGDRRAWSGRDADRPLDAAGRARADTVAGLLTAYDVRRAGTADVLRCRETLAPFARSAEVEVQVLPATTAGTFADDPEAAAADVAALLLDGSGAAAWCGQREVIPRLAAELCTRLGGDAVLAGTADLEGLGKGRLLVLHVDERSHLVALERLPG